MQEVGRPGMTLKSPDFRLLACQVPIIVRLTDKLLSVWEPGGTLYKVFWPVGAWQAGCISIRRRLRMADYKSDTADYRHSYNRSVSEAQERNVELRNAREKRAKQAIYNAETILYSLYTESRPNLSFLTSRYFPGHTIYSGDGCYQGVNEPARVIEIVGKRDDLQHIFDLAGDIRVVNAQESVLITWQAVSSYSVTA